MSYAPPASQLPGTTAVAGPAKSPPSSSTTFPQNDVPLIVNSAEISLKMTYRDQTVKELVHTERKYVQDLEKLYELKRTLEDSGYIPGDIIDQIFLNIDALLDFQRRFLIQVEATNSMPTANQLWGAPFSTSEGAFDIYPTFISNQRKASKMANQVLDKIRISQHPIAADFYTLDGFLMKPMSRLAKYPLLLKDLIKNTDDVETKKDLHTGCEFIERVLHKANEAVDRDLLDEAFEDLINRVDDWKSHNVQQFGKLILHGTYGISGSKDATEKDVRFGNTDQLVGNINMCQYEIYLFDCILLCCKRFRGKINEDQKDTARSRGSHPNENIMLRLKGSIFMTHVIDIVSTSKPGSHNVQVWWKGDSSVKSFTIKFAQEWIMKKWAQSLENQRKQNTPRTSIDPQNQATPNFTST